MLILDSVTLYVDIRFRNILIKIKSILILQMTEFLGSFRYPSGAAITLRIPMWSCDMAVITMVPLWCH